nr:MULTISPECIES: CdaR family protein [unclassified Fusibacter]
MPIEIVQKGSVEAPYIFGGVSSVPKDVVVSGPRRFVDKVTHVVAHIDLTEARSTFEWVSTLVPLDENDEVVNKVTLSSKETKLIANIMEEKTVRIVPLIVDELPLGYKLISAALDNQLVTLVGITEVIDQLDGVTIEPISLKDRTESKAEEVILSLPAGVTESVESVHVLNLEIEAVVERAFSPTSDQITWLNQAENTEVVITDPQLLEIVLSGVESQINQIELEDIKLLIELSEKAPGEYILPVTLVVDADVEWLLPVEDRQVNVLITESTE